MVAARSGWRKAAKVFVNGGGHYAATGENLRTYPCIGPTGSQPATGNGCINKSRSRSSALARIDPGLLAKSDPHRAPEEAVWREANGGNSRLRPTGKTNWFGENELVTRKRDLSLALVLFLPWGQIVSLVWCILSEEKGVILGRRGAS